MNSDPKYQEGEPPTPEGLDPSIVVSPDTRRENRIPPGQSRTRQWPVLDASGPPNLDPAKWSLTIFGLVEKPVKLTLDDFQKLPRVKVFADFHCVTRWSRLGNIWEGVSTRALLDLAKPLANAQFVLCHAFDYGWTTNLPLDAFRAEDALLADLHDGEEISLEHGGPVRGMVPRLYAWKSAKWIRGIELMAEDKPGYWEAGGYHMYGDPWTINHKNPDGERFRDDSAWGN